MTRSTSLRLAFALSASLLLTGPTVPFAAALEETSEAKDAQPDWDVMAERGPRRTVAIDATEVTWSSVDVHPSGDRIVFDALGDLYTVPMSGGDAVPLTDDLAWNSQPRFSPDGRQIAFISDRDGGDNLWLMDADGSNLRAISSEKENLVHSPAWSPDGRWIAAQKGFVSARSLPATEIWLFYRTPGGGWQLTERPFGKTDQKIAGEPSFAADGKHLFYARDVRPGRVWEYNGDPHQGIYAIERLELATGEIEAIAGGPGGAVRPTVSPDGRQLAFVRRTRGQPSALWIKDLRSGEEQMLFDGLDRDLQEAHGSFGNYPAIGWLPGSDGVVFWASGGLWRIGLDGAAPVRIPLRLRKELSIRQALRVPVSVSPDAWPIRMPRWMEQSPVGDPVVFSALGRLYEQRAGAAAEALQTPGGFAFFPSFGADGKTMVFASWDDERLGAVWLREPGKREASTRRLTPDPGHYVEPRLSPDGGAVVYRKIQGGDLLSPSWSLDPGLYVVGTTEGSVPQRIRRSGYNAHFGAESDRIYFSEGTDDGELALKSVDLAGRDERHHVTGKRASAYRVSPDGRWLAFLVDFDVFVAPLTPTGRTVELGRDSEAVPVARVSRRAATNLHWSADSRELRWSWGPTLYRRELTRAFADLEGAPDPLPEPVDAGVTVNLAVPADRPGSAVALVGGRIVTMRNAGSDREVIESGVVVIEGDRITAVGVSGEVPVPARAQVIDVTGTTITPGFIDVHAHGSTANQGITPQQSWRHLSALSFGVTTQHDPSNDTAEIFAAAEMQRAGVILAPRIFSTGSILYGAYANGVRARIESLDDARFHVRRMADAGAITVKSYQQPRRDQRQQIVEAAAELGVMVVTEGGMRFEHDITEVIDGHTGVEHSLPLARVYDDLLQLWGASATGNTPTLVVAFGGLEGENYWYDRTEVWKHERLMRFVPASAVDPVAIRRQRAPDDEYNHVAVATNAKAMMDRGITIQVGAHGQREGLAFHWEMWMLEQGGFSPWEVLRAATMHGAAYLGLDGDLGSIEAGKLADLVVIDGNPLEDLSYSERVRLTVLGGRVYDAATMNEVAPGSSERPQLYFERDPALGRMTPAGTAAALGNKAEALGWTH